MIRNPLRSGGVPQLGMLLMSFCVGASAFVGSPGLAEALADRAITPTPDGPSAHQVPGIAAILFLDYDAPSRPGFDPAEMHREAWGLLDSALADRGAEVVSREDIETLLYRWRVRSGENLSREFLDTLATAFGAGGVLVADLTVYSDRLHLTARDTRLPSGDVVWAGSSERRFSDGAGADGAVRTEAARAVCAGLAEDWTGHPPGQGRADIFLLPVRRQGVDAAAAGLITNCLLRSLIEADWRPEDPGLTFSRLLEAGIDPSSPDGRVRKCLSEAAGGPCALLFGELTSDASPSRHVSEFVEDDNAPAQPALQLLPVSLSLRLVDSGDGTVLFAETGPVARSQAPGLFGVIRNQSLDGRFQPTIDRLARAARREDKGM